MGSLGIENSFGHGRRLFRLSCLRPLRIGNVSRSFSGDLRTGNFCFGNVAQTQYKSSGRGSKNFAGALKIRMPCVDREPECWGGEEWRKNYPEVLLTELNGLKRTEVLTEPRRTK